MTAAQGTIRRVRTLTADGKPSAEVEPGAFAQRLAAEPSVVTSGSRVWLGGFPDPKGSYPIPPRGRDFRLKDANLRAAGGVGDLLAALGTADPPEEYGIRLKSDSGKTNIALGNFAYGETVPRERMEEEVAFKLGRRPNDTRPVEAALAKCRLVVEAASAAGAGATRRTTAAKRSAQTASDDFWAVTDEDDRPTGRTTTRRTATDAKPVVSGLTLLVGQPKMKTNAKETWHSKYSASSDKTITKVSAYEGKVSCNVSNGGTATVTVEAYFITREIGQGSQETIAKETTVGAFTFGGTNPRVQKFEFQAPAVKEFKETSGYSGSYSSHRNTSRTGTRYCGVIVRALVDGKIEKVMSVPNNPKWVKAGKQKVVSLP